MKQTTLEETLRAFDETLRPLYLECEAGFAEDLQCEIARKAVSLIETERSKTIRGFRKELHSLLPAFPTQNKRVLDSVELWYNLMDMAEEQYLAKTKGENKMKEGDYK